MKSRDKRKKAKKLRELREQEPAPTRRDDICPFCHKPRDRHEALLFHIHAQLAARRVPTNG